MHEIEPSSLIVEGRNVIVTEAVERSVAERPAHDTIEAIVAWLIAGARQLSSFPRTLDELSWRLVATRMPLLRVSLRGGTLRTRSKSPSWHGAIWALC